MLAERQEIKIKRLPREIALKIVEVFCFFVSLFVCLSYFLMKLLSLLVNKLMVLNVLCFKKCGYIQSGIGSETVIDPTAK